MKNSLPIPLATRRRVLGVLARVSETVARALYMLYVCRVSVIVCVAVFALAFVGQVQEVVRVDVLDWTGGAAAHLATRAAWHLVADFVLLVVLGGSTMFWAHYALASRFPPPLAHNAILRWQLKGLPALLACLPTTGGFIALRGAAEGLTEGAGAWASGLSWASLAIGPAVVTAFYALRRWLDPQGAAPASRIGPAVPSMWHRGVLGVSVVAALACFVFVAVDAIAYGRWLGTIGVLLSACLSVMPVLAWATTSPHLPRWHLLTTMVLVGAAFSAANLNDNHVLRVEPGQAAYAGFGDTFDRWLKHRAALRPDPTQPVPVILVAAEGGGIRAAYFTAKVLAVLQDTCPAFAQYLFGISGVSGGSVGATVFTGLLDALGPKEPLRPLRDCGAPSGPPLSPAVDTVLGEDFIAPLAASMLFTDGVQRLLPIPVPAWDRARTLEDGLERAFNAVAPGSFLRRSMHEYWSHERRLPQLWLQTTSVGTGERVMFSPVVFVDEKFNGLRTVQDTGIDFNAPVSLRTAAVASARFPIVTPAATLPREPPLRLVDGGYFENAGATTLGEALWVLFQVADQAGIPITPVLIRIGNTPDAGAASAQGFAASAPPPAEPMALGETLSPLRALLSARVGRGDLAVRMLRTRVAESLELGRWAELHEFQIGLSRVDIPLGWQISALARQEMLRQLQPKPGKDCSRLMGFENDCAVAAVRDSLVRHLSGAMPGPVHAAPAGVPTPAASAMARARKPGEPVR